MNKKIKQVTKGNSQSGIVENQDILDAIEDFEVACKQCVLSKILQSKASLFISLLFSLLGACIMLLIAFFFPGLVDAIVSGLGNAGVMILHEKSMTITEAFSFLIPIAIFFVCIFILLGALFLNNYRQYKRNKDLNEIIKKVKSQSLPQPATPGEHETS